MESFNKNEAFAVKKLARRLIEEQDKVLRYFCPISLKRAGRGVREGTWGNLKAGSAFASSIKHQQIARARGGGWGLCAITLATSAELCCVSDATPCWLGMVCDGFK